jgi:hypothetical protein
MKKVAEFPDGGIGAMFCVDEDPRGPELFSNFGTSDKLSFTRCKQDKEFHRLALDTKNPVLATHFEAAAIDLKLAELQCRTGQGGGHGRLLRGSIHSFVA